MVDPVTASAAPPEAPIPDWLVNWESDISTSTVPVWRETAGQYDRVTLHNFTFFGRQFSSAPYIAKAGSAAGAVVPGIGGSGAGVCAEFKNVLVRVQRRAFQYYYRGLPAGTTPTADGFTTWCGVPRLAGWQCR